ncbi:MAG: patatin-like phospholipase family protein [Blastocatellia bacterium]
MTEPGPLPLYEVLEEEYVALHGPLPDSHYKQTPKARLKGIYAHIHALENKRAAICISGGGIRSATFALGVLQGLARLKLLKEFDYLSTVSGGGYVGGWLSAWIHRDPGGADGVFSKLKDKPQSPLDPEAKPIRHLRSYSNYLSPKLGLLSADTWTLVAIIVRNLILNWTVFFPLMLAVLIVPRLFTSFIRINLLDPTTKKYVLTGLLLLAFILGVVAVIYIAVFRPGLNKYREEKYKSLAGQGGFLKWCLVPTLALGLLLCVYWAWLRNSSEDMRTQTSPVLGIHIEYPWAFLLFGFLLYFVSWLVHAILLRRFNLTELLLTPVVGLAGGNFLWLAATQVFPQPVYDAEGAIPKAEYFVCFALPLLLVLLLLAVTLFVGLASRLTEDEDREWLARYGAWVLIAALGWSFISYIVIFGPDWLIRAHVTVKAAVAAAGGISGFLVVMLGRSAGTAANDKQQGKGKQSLVKDIALKLAAPTFVLIFLVALSLATSQLIISLKSLLATNPLGIDWHVTPLPHTLAREFGHLEVIHYSSIRVVLLLFGVFLAIGLAMSVVININKFSLHSMYRNRIIRAYLGASRENRCPNPFTGFDPDDNIQMHELRPGLFHAGSFANPARYLNKLINSSDALSQYLRTRIPKTLEVLNNLERTDSATAVDLLIEELNETLEGEQIYDNARFTNVTLSEETKATLAQNPTGNNQIVLNRMLLEDAYPDEINNFRSRKPFHVVNMALNLVHGDNLAWQQRKAESFTASPLHCGSYTIRDSETGARGCYRNAKEYGGDDGISLGTAVAISGAAVSPNMGYHSSSVITFLLTLFNARLGWWLGNPGRPGSSTYKMSGPFFSVRPLIAEAFGLTDDKNRYVYLSDGGHFENLAFYEMVLRRCNSIVVSDGSQDPDCAFDDLGGALRKIRVDLGVRISIDKIMIYSRKSDKQGKYCAVGTIHYSEVDGAGVSDGTLIYIKPAICNGEPADVFNYAQTSKMFPHETTADQFFSEAQFESYRALGDHAIMQMSKGWNKTGGLAGWADQIKTGYLQLLPKRE